MPCGSFHLHFGTCLVERRAHCYSALTVPQVPGSQSLVSPVPLPAFRWVQGSDLESLVLATWDLPNPKYANHDFSASYQATVKFT